jgi:uncharacterized repeat protein (TIGR03837 family)
MLGHTAAIVDNRRKAIDPAMLWDIFCKVIDNHGDIGVCWRLSVQLAARGQQVRLWVDDGSALGWIAPEGCPAVQVLPWTLHSPPPEPGEVVIEAFGCELTQAFQAAIAARTRAQERQPAWINLEYLTAESFAERSHGLRSPVLAGPAAGLTKHFFYPGFTPRTGGLLHETDLMERQARFDRAAWLRRHGIEAGQANGNGARLVSLFCYEPVALDQLLAFWAREDDPTQLLVTAGRAAQAVRVAIERISRSNPAWNQSSRLSLSWLPLLSQLEFDHLLWACDLNFVRGEDSLVRAVWAGKPLVWQIYPQDDDVHHRKLAAFLDWLEAPPGLREFQWTWNGVGSSLPAQSLEPWRECLQQARTRLLAQDDLVTQLMRFVSNEQGRP